MAKRKDYSGLSKDELIAVIRKLEKKRYGLVWEDKPEEVADRCDRELPVLVHRPDKEILDDPGGPTNLLIEGDNYHALFALNFTHRRKVDVIYIDPPYNTRAKDWKYNNDYVDKNDRWKHSKWISMMHKRLRLAKPLLAEEGIIICAIDEYEVHNCRHLLDQVFGETNKLGMVTVLHNPKGRNQGEFFSPNSDFFLVYAKNRRYAEFNDVAIDEEKLATFDEEDDSGGKFRWEPFMRVRSSWQRKNKPKNFYPIYVSPDLTHLSDEPKDHYTAVYPRTPDGREWAWKTVLPTFKNDNKNSYFKAEREEGEIVIYHRYGEQQVFKNVWTNKKYQSEFNGTKVLSRILGPGAFEYPKSIFLLIDILKIVSKRDSVILDFFAGSGTTGHATLELNYRDGGERKFILCTNNENKIAEHVCYERIKRVINGNAGFSELEDVLLETKFDEKALNDCSSIAQKIADIRSENEAVYSAIKVRFENNTLRVKGTRELKALEKRPSNLRYFTTDFVPSVLTDNDKRVLVARSTELICIAEDTFELVASSKRKNEFAIFKNARHTAAIIYDEDAIAACVAKLNGLNPKGTTAIYVFSYDQDYDRNDFLDLTIKFKVKPIPEAILNVYRRNAKLRRK